MTVASGRRAANIAPAITDRAAFPVHRKISCKAARLPTPLG